VVPAAEVEIARDNTILSRVMSRPTGVFIMYTTCLRRRPSTGGWVAAMSSSVVSRVGCWPGRAGRCTTLTWALRIAKGGPFLCRLTGLSECQGYYQVSSPALLFNPVTESCEQASSPIWLNSTGDETTSTPQGSRHGIAKKYFRI